MPQHPERLPKLLTDLEKFWHNADLLLPVLYLSGYLEKNKSDYYDQLTMVRKTGDLQVWLRFFMAAIEQAYQRSIRLLERVVVLVEEYNQLIMPLSGPSSQNCLQLLQTLYERPGCQMNN